MFRSRTAGSAAVVAFVAMVAPAHAATVKSDEACLGPHGDCSSIVSFAAAPGEANDVTITGSGPGFRVRDTGAPLTAGKGCRQVDQHAAECGLTELDYVNIDTGDGDDRVTGSVQGDVLLGPGDDVLAGGEVGGVSGGPGDDVLSGSQRGSSWSGDDGSDRMSATGFDVQLNGGAGDDELTGGSGSDQLDGGPGADVLHGGAGDDALTGDDATVAADTLDGGDGNDTVSYGARTAPVTVDLARGDPGGEAGEGDRLVSIEGAGGGSGADVLTGDDGPNQLYGGPGDDILTGAGGNDVLAGDSGFDRFDAGDGDDTIVSSSGASGEPLDCGAGQDVVSAYRDIADPSCETSRFAIVYGFYARFALVPLRTGPRAATFAVPCPKLLRTHRRCTGTLTLRGGGERQRTHFDVGRHGGTVRVRRPAATGVLLQFRFAKAHAQWGDDVYITLPG